MASRFVALPVGQGDAFYLKRNGVHILVDAGRSSSAFPGILTAHADPPRVDVVVCTHNDADHANGIIGLLEVQPVPIREVWLPGTWAWRFKDLISAPLEFFEEVDLGIREVGEDVETLEEWYEQNRTRLPRSQFVDSREQSADAAGWLLHIFEQHGTEDRDAFLPEMLLLHYSCMSRRVRRLWVDCLNAAHRIRVIIGTALNAGCRIRLFESVAHPELASGGWRGCLEPVNCREVLPRGVRVPALFYLALTKANRESLVFYAPEQTNNNAPGVLFTADCDLAFGLEHMPRPLTNLVVTPPHHGSEANGGAYQVVTSWIEEGKAIWVRSDCRSGARPGNSFKRQSKRACTLCNPPTAPKAPVRLHAIRSCWQRTPGTRWCSCR